MEFDPRQFPDPSPPPVKEPPDSPEQPDVPVREPDPAEPSLAERGRKQVPFVFRPRFVINAMSAPSVLYDDYNPEADAAVLPIRFNVQ
jgi:hypothetical protein